MGLLDGKTAIVTGAARGIGKAIALKFASEGANIAFTDLVIDENAENTTKEIEAMGVKAKGYASNAANFEDTAKVVEAIHADFGRIDILVNNAGISQSTPLYNYTAEEFDKCIDLNVRALFYAILPVAKIMKEQGGGCILNTSSMVSISGQPAGVGYPTSKFAVNGMTISLARELAKDKIRVNAVAPGVTRTDMVASLPPEMVARISAQIPLGRPGEPEEVANAFLYLASDLASYVTGGNFVGGRSKQGITLGCC